jgi:large subunit ribosomal protein L32e
MVINKDLLQLRKKIAEKRPDFVRQESWRYKKLATNWRKPKGKDNKMRKQVSGVPPLVKVGYKGPRKARGLHPSGYNDILVFNTKDLMKIDPKKDAARIAHAVGNKKRIDIVTEATELKIKVLNPGKVDVKKLAEKPEPKVKKEVEPKVKKEVEPKVKKEVEPKVKKEVEPKVKKEVEPKVKKEVEPKVKKEVEPKSKRLGKKVSKS